MKNVVLLFLLISAFTLNSQTDTTFNSRKDLFDVLRSRFKTKDQIRKDTLARKSNLVYWSILPGFGYAQQKGFSAVCTNNASFYFHKDSVNKISSIDFIVEYTQYKQFLFPIISTIWTRGNKFCLQGDWRYLKYSTKAYGLGGVNHDSDAELINYSHFRFHQLVMRQLAKDVLVGVGYNLDCHWNIIPDASNGSFYNGDIRNYGFDSSCVSSGFVLNFLFDERKNSNNPSQGYYANAMYRSSSKRLGATQNWNTIRVDLRKYFSVSRNSNNILAFWSYNWFTLSGKQPYFDLPGNGWDTESNVARAFRQGRYTAKNLIYIESEYRFDITRNGLIAGSVFANALSVSNKTNTKFDPILPGAGCSIRMLANKYANTHLVLSYAIGLNGASGFSFNLGEAF